MELHNSEWKKANGCFYALASKCRMSSDDVHATIFNAYGKTHTTELTPEQLRSLCASLKEHALPEQERKLEMLRRRVLNTVRKYCRLMGYQDTAMYAIHIIERGGKSFNKMTEAELMRKYNTFNKLTQDLTTEKAMPGMAVVMGEA